MSYFDNNATCPLYPIARESLVSALDEAWQNPSSPYRRSARVYALLEAAREKMAGALKCDAQEIIFNSGATEGNNAVFAWAKTLSDEDSCVLVSRTEHPSVIESAKASFGTKIIWLEVDENGVVSCEQLEKLLREQKVSLVAIMAANNETGVVAPVKEIGSLCRSFGVKWLCDATQWIGELSATELPAADFLVGSAHKFGGPKGVGFLRLSSSVGDFHSARGGEQEEGRRGGTSNYPAIAAMCDVLSFLDQNELAEVNSRVAWREAFEERLLKTIPGLVINSSEATRLWNTVSLRMPSQENTRWLRKLDKEGFEVSTGSACSTGSEEPSHVLSAQGLMAEVARRTIRISSGWLTTEGEWVALADAIEKIWHGFSGDGGDAFHIISV
ncbi:MAG: cysteine desulfurase [Opitutaceae bacterium]|nr:cysteine desulfurase [Opitutaceae bacterium]